MRYTQLTEGVRYGTKEQNTVLSNLNDFAFGYEIELNVPVNEQDQVEILIDEEMSISSDYYDELLEALKLHVTDDVWEALIPRRFNVLKIFNPDVLSKMIELIQSVGAIDNADDMDAVLDGIETIVKGVGYASLASYVDDISSVTDEYPKLFVSYALRNELDYDSIILTQLRHRFVKVFSYLVDLFRMADESSDPDFPSIEGNILDLKSELEEIQNVTAMEGIETDEQEILTNALMHLMDEDVPVVTILSILGLSTLEKNLVLLSLTEYGYIFEFESDADNLILDGIDDYESYFEYVLESLELEAYAPLFKVEREADGQIEIILETPVSGQDIIKHYDIMCMIINEFIERGFTAQNNSGLHMSISYKNGSGDINKNKFLMLSQLYGVITNNPTFVRTHVNNIFRAINIGAATAIADAILDSRNLGTAIVDIVDEQLKHLESPEQQIQKYNSVNFGGYYTHDGRIELRFFGGSDYDSSLDEYKDILFKMFYILKVSFDDSFDNTYYQEMYKLTSKVFKRSMQVDINTAANNIKLSKKYLQRLNIDIEDMNGPLSELLSDMDGSDSATKLKSMVDTHSLTTKSLLQPWVVSALKELVTKHRS